MSPTTLSVPGSCSGDGTREHVAEVYPGVVYPGWWPRSCSEWSILAWSTLALPGPVHPGSTWPGPPWLHDRLWLHDPGSGSVTSRAGSGSGLWIWLWIWTLDLALSLDLTLAYTILFSYSCFIGFSPVDWITRQTGQTGQTGQTWSQVNLVMTGHLRSGQSGHVRTSEIWNPESQLWSVFSLMLAPGSRIKVS